MSFHVAVGTGASGIAATLFDCATQTYAMMPVETPED